MTQWNNPTKGDWTEQVKVDLADFEISSDFNEVRSKTKMTFKKNVKTKAKEYALKMLTKQQEKHSKMKNVHYKKLEIQEYFETTAISLEQKRTIFRWRTRMEKFGENFRGVKGPIICPLCKTHLDNQALSLQCPVIKKETNMDDTQRDIQDLY